MTNKRKDVHSHTNCKLSMSWIKEEPLEEDYEALCQQSGKQDDHFSDEEEFFIEINPLFGCTTSRLLAYSPKS